MVMSLAKAGYVSIWKLLTKWTKCVPIGQSAVIVFFSSSVSPGRILSDENVGVHPDT